MHTVVIGLGNVLASDDAAGVAVASALARQDLPPAVRVVEWGTAGLGLIDLLLDAERAILVDAVCGCGAPGYLVRCSEQDLRRAVLLPLSAHGPALPEALALGRLLYPKAMPREVILFGVEAERLDPYREGLSPAVKAAVSRAVRAIMAELRSPQVTACRARRRCAAS